ncbi:MAG TPA: VanZ family protein [Nocardioides sp.]|nr:VanZ family protein [Nocardioides sp.]
MVRSVALLLLLCYCVLVANLTLMDPSSGAWAFDSAAHLADAYSGGRMAWSETEVLANVALFVPVGFLLVLLLGRVWPAVVLGVLGSALIEVMQAEYLPLRVGTATDVLHNGYGAAIGALLASPYALLRSRHRLA